MSHDTSFQPGAETSDEESATSFRRRWATTVAVVTIFVHFLVFLVVGGWWYFIAPRFKEELDKSGQVTSSQVFLIHQSDFFVNYWYVFVLAGPVLLAFDFLLIRYIGREFRLRAAVASGVIIAMIYLAYPLAGFYILSR